MGSEELRARLCDLGFETDENQEEMLLDALKRAEQSIVNTCNCEGVPEELYFTFLDMAAGEYLLAASSGEREGKVKSITEGDVSVTYFDKTDTENIIDTLLGKGREELVSYRRIKW